MFQGGQHGENVLEKWELNKLGSMTQTMPLKVIKVPRSYSQNKLWGQTLILNHLHFYRLATEDWILSSLKVKNDTFFLSFLSSFLLFLPSFLPLFFFLQHFYFLKPFYANIHYLTRLPEGHMLSLKESEFAQGIPSVSMTVNRFQDTSHYWLKHVWRCRFIHTTHQSPPVCVKMWK